MRLSLLTFPAIPDILLRRLRIGDLCEAAAANGLTGLEMMASEARLYGVKKVREAAHAAGLALTCLIAYVPMCAYKEKRAANAITRALGLAEKLDCARLMIVPMRQFEAGRLKPRDKEMLFADYVRGFNLAAGLCAKAGVRLCFEDTPTCLLPLSSAEECERLLAAVDGLELVYDTANMLPALSRPETFYERLKDRITHVHLKDVEYAAQGQDRCADGRFIRCCDFGAGVVPVKALYNRLLADGFRGTAAIEYTPPSRHDKAGHAAHLKAFVDYLKN